MARETADFYSQIAGIPCGIKVTHYLNVPGRDTWDSDLDYYGYTEFEFDVLDRKGYRAKWLEEKLTDADIERLEAEYTEMISAIDY